MAEVKADDEFQPPDLMFSCAVMDTAFHPTHNVIAVGLVSGRAEL